MHRSAMIAFILFYFVFSPKDANGFCVCDDCHRHNALHLAFDEGRCGNQPRIRARVENFSLRLCASSVWVE